MILKWGLWINSAVKLRGLTAFCSLNKRLINTGIEDKDIIQTPYTCNEYCNRKGINNAVSPVIHQIRQNDLRPYNDEWSPLAYTLIRNLILPWRILLRVFNKMERMQNPYDLTIIYNVIKVSRRHSAIKTFLKQHLLRSTEVCSSRSERLTTGFVNSYC
jgi:hypothetical protein